MKIDEDEFLEHVGDDKMTDQELYVFLEHYGVKGMQWGVRNEKRGESGSRKERRVKNRALNKASRGKDRAKFTSDIDKARARIDSGKSFKDVKKAKSQYKQNKIDLGSREARKILSKARNKYATDSAVAQQARDGKEVAKALAIAGAATILSVALRTR